MEYIGGSGFARRHLASVGQLRGANWPAELGQLR